MGFVEVRYFGYLADHAGGPVVRVRVEGEARVADVVRLPEGVGFDDVIILVNGVPAGPDRIGRPGDRVSVMPHISGGQQGKSAPGVSRTCLA